MESHSLPLAMQGKACKQRKGKGSKPFTVACRLSEKDFLAFEQTVLLNLTSKQGALESLIRDYINYKWKGGQINER